MRNEPALHKPLPHGFNFFITTQVGFIVDKFSYLKPGACKIVIIDVLFKNMTLNLEMELNVIYSDNTCSFKPFISIMVIFILLRNKHLNRMFFSVLV